MYLHNVYSNNCKCTLAWIIHMSTKLYAIWTLFSNSSIKERIILIIHYGIIYSLVWYIFTGMVYMVWYGMVWYEVKCRKKAYFKAGKLEFEVVSHNFDTFFLIFLDFGRTQF